MKVYINHYNDEPMELKSNSIIRFENDKEEWFEVYMGMGGGHLIVRSMRSMKIYPRVSNSIEIGVCSL